MSKTGIAGELAATYTAIALVTGAVAYAPGLSGDVGHLALAAAFLFSALALARRDRRGAAHYGIDLGGLLEPPPDDPGLLRSLVRGLPVALRELGFAAKVAILVFPPFVLAYARWHEVTQPFTWHPLARPVDFALGQLLVVALPEEALFRGYFQTRLSDLFAQRTRLLGAELCLPALVIQALLFALLHFLVGLAPGRLAVFFPALLFGYMRARRGGIGAAVWFHALCNALSEILSRGWS